MALLFLSGGCQKPVVEPPVLTMSTTEYTAPAAGGNVTVAYKVANPVEGTTVKVVGAEEYSWVKVTGVSPNVVLAVEANDTEAEFTLSYAGAADKCEFTLVQAAGEGGDEPGSDAERLEMSYSTLHVYTAEGLAYYYGDYFGTGGNWVFLIGSERACDRVRAEIVAEASDFSAGIPSGTYRVSVSDEPAAGEFVAGRLNDFGSFSGTWYTSWDEAEVCTASAPAVGGTVEVVNHGDRSYDIVFDCTDDRGYVWSGSWSGSLEALDYSGSSSLAN